MVDEHKSIDADDGGYYSACMDKDQRTEPTDASISSERNDSRGSRAIRICIITTIGKSIQILYEGRLEYFVAHGFDVTAACASSELDDAIRARGARFQAFPLTRAVMPFGDLRALVQMVRFFRREKFEVVEVATPKAALVGSIAAWFAMCPCVVHIAHGLAYEGKRGLLNFILRMSVRVPCRLAHITFAVSESVRREIIGNGLGRAEGIRVIGAGSANGINISRFSPEQRAEGRAIRDTHRIPPDAVVIGFIGRLVRDKGVEELAEAFRGLRREFPQAILLLVGDYEHRDKPSQACVDFFATDSGVRAVGWQNTVIPFLAAMDIFVLPTYREGLPGVLLEAAAMGLPTITTNATGARDAMVDGVTGLRVPIGDASALREAISRLVRDSMLRESMGRTGREWVCANFEQSKVWNQWTEEYRKLARGA
ncbi:MAG: glycosyltransferase family 4 protein [Planctomycetes bacterium]|nr:glycosyltransferase family 4 protein [Planctomycetota bacterium]MBI3834806.1 glycosyltransferase family 4 protein [Planctomycetota bacterium]